MNNECPNCGYKMSSKERVCKYCGTPNSKYVPGIISAENFFKNKVQSVAEPVGKAGFVFAGIVFLFIFWPVSIFFFIMASKVGKEKK